MHRAAARLIAVVQHAQRRRARIPIRPPGDRLALRVRARVLALEEAQLVHRLEVRLHMTRPTLECDHTHAGLRELGRENGAGSPYADDDDIGSLGRHLTHSALWIGDRR